MTDKEKTQKLKEENSRQRHEIVELNRIIKEQNVRLNKPYNEDWLQGVCIEIMYQETKWEKQDANKRPEDWFWTLGYLAGKCLYAYMHKNKTKAKHHTISAAALLYHWHKKISQEEKCTTQS